MTYNRARKHNIKKTLKDYAVPIIAFFLILILAFNLFGGDDSDSNTQDTNIMENAVGASVVFYNESSAAEIEYSGGDKKKLEDGSNLYKGEKIIVKNGSVKIDFPYLASSHLDKNTILSYKEDNSLNLESSNLWLKANSDMTVDMTFAKVKLSEGTIVNLYQNDLFSEISCVSGKVEVYNLAGENTVLSSAQQLSIERKDASNGDLDLSLLKSDFSDYFKASDWFAKNDGDLYLNSSSDLAATSTGEVKKVLYSSMSSVLEFDNLVDESFASGDSIDITGTFGEDVARVVLNNQEAKLNSETRAFKFLGVSLLGSENDLVFKAYNSSGEVLAKTVYTIYTKGGSSKSSSNSGDFGKVLNFDLDASKFVFTSPSTTGTYTTYDTQVTIKGSVPSGIVSSVTVNGYKLGSFNGTTWRYHAWADYDNLKDGSNLYEVKYYDSNSKLIYTNYFTIIKKVKSTPEPEAKEKEAYSSEVNVS